MATAVLSKADIAADECRFDWRKFVSEQALPTQQFIHRSVQHQRPPGTFLSPRPSRTLELYRASFLASSMNALSNQIALERPHACFSRNLHLFTTPTISYTGVSTEPR